MTANDVKNYRFLDQAIRMAAKRVDDLSHPVVLSDKVYGSNPEYPYEQRSFKVQGYDSGFLSRREIELEDAQYEYHRLLTKKMEIETAFRSLTDASERILFEMTMQGKKQSEIAEVLHLERSTVSKRLTRICEALSFGE